MRIDKWLWAARFFKTRAIAARACEFGRVAVGGTDAKPAREVRVGDQLRIRTDSGDFVVDVLLLLPLRGPAAQARTMYAETAGSVKDRQLAAEQRRAMPFQDASSGRLSKKDRRDWEKLRAGE